MIGTVERRASRLWRVARMARRCADTLLAIALGLPLLAALAWRRARLPRRTADPANRRILYLGTGNSDQVGPRNGANLFLTGECSDFGGFFSRVYNVSFPAGQRKAWPLTDRHLLVDYDSPLGLALGRLGLRAAGLVVRELSFLQWAVDFIGREQVCLIEATNPYLQGLNAWLLARLCGLPYAVLVTRDYDFDYQAIGKLAFPTLFPSRRVEKLVERWVFGHADLVLADRQYYLEYGLRNGARPARARRTRVVVDEAYYSDPAQRPPVRARLGLPEGPLLLLVGRLQPDKLPDDSIRCLALVRQRGHDAHLAVAGEGELRPLLERLARELGVADQVHFLSTVPLDLLPALMASADVIVCAHMGYTLLEAALAARPIVTYDYEWHGEIIRDGETGLLVPFRDVAALAEAVARVLADPALGTRLGEAARAFALARHDRTAVMADYRRIYGEVLRARARSGAR